MQSRRSPTAHEGHTGVFLWLGYIERTFFGGTIATADLGPIET